MSITLLQSTIESLIPFIPAFLILSLLVILIFSYQLWLYCINGKKRTFKKIKKLTIPENRNKCDLTDSKFICWLPQQIDFENKIRSECFLKSQTGEYLQLIITRKKYSRKLITYDVLLKTEEEVKSKLDAYENFLISKIAFLQHP